MNRAEFMRRLTELLSDVSPMEREEAIQYYNDYFDDAGEENESDVISSLGTPEELARSIKAGLNDGGNGGEFTESGFSGYTHAPKDEIMRTENSAAGEQPGQENTWSDGVYNGSPQQEGVEYGSSQNGNSYYDGAYYKRPEGDGIYGGRTDNRTYNNPYEQSRAQNTDTYGAGNTQNRAYGQNGSQNTAYGQGNTQNGQYGQSSSGKKKMSGGMIALIAILAVLTSPVWIGLLGAFFGIAAGVIITLFALFLSFLIVGVVLVAVAVALLITGISLMFSLPSGGLCVLGGAFACFAVGLLFVWLMIIMAGTAIPACIRGIVSLCQRIFHRGGAWA